MESQKHPLEHPSDDINNNTSHIDEQLSTHDVQDDAQEALQRYLTNHPESEIPPTASVIGEEIHLHLEVQGWSEPLSVIFEQEAVIGRKDPMLGFTPDIDLTAYGGYQMGISRKHAVIRRNGDQLQLIDLGSRNGTFLNGKKLDAEETVLLHHYDEIRLGKIVITLHVQQEEKS